MLTEPIYAPGVTPSGNYVALAVESMRRHMTDEGWQIMAGLQHAGYSLAGRDLPINETNVDRILEICNPVDTVVVQDKREWDLTGSKDFRDPLARFYGIETLASRPDIFKVTI